ncbi:MAG: hypothetical protein K2X27_18995, partial [Candidatus Obscuribacterales bacterium]|nr:hypothetical protein [Candidatus Obscuribacterales bacterium]
NSDSLATMIGDKSQIAVLPAAEKTVQAQEQIKSVLKNEKRRDASADKMNAVEEFSGDDNELLSSSSSDKFVLEDTDTRKKPAASPALTAEKKSPISRGLAKDAPTASVTISSGASKKEKLSAPSSSQLAAASGLSSSSGLAAGSGGGATFSQNTLIDINTATETRKKGAVSNTIAFNGSGKTQARNLAAYGNSTLSRSNVGSEAGAAATTTTTTSSSSSSLTGARSGALMPASENYGVQASDEALERLEVLCEVLAEKNEYKKLYEASDCAIKMAIELNNRPADELARLYSSRAWAELNLTYMTYANRDAFKAVRYANQSCDAYSQAEAFSVAAVAARANDMIPMSEHYHRRAQASIKAMGGESASALTKAAGYRFQNPAPAESASTGR